jgi:hypothetical protein
LAFCRRGIVGVVVLEEEKLSNLTNMTNSTESLNCMFDGNNYIDWSCRIAEHVEGSEHSVNIIVFGVLALIVLIAWVMFNR